MKSEIQTMENKKDHFFVSEDIFDERSYSLNKRLLCLVGHWPYQSAKHRNFMLAVILCASCGGLGPQMLALINTWGQLDAFVATVGAIWSNIGCVVIVINFRLNIHKIRKILDDTKKDWESITYLPHLKILQEHGEKSRLFTIMYCSLMYGGLFGYVTPPLISKFLDVFVPLNYSRPKSEIYPTEYLIDPDKYFWLIYFHILFNVVLVMSPTVAMDAVYVCFARHVSGMFEILRYDLERMLSDDDQISDVMLEPKYDEDIFYSNIVACIKRHKVLTQYVNSIQSTCEWMLLIIMLMSVIAVSFAGYQLVAEGTRREDRVRMGIFTLIETYHIYCITLPGHWISEASSFLPISVYGCKWYMMSLRSRKLIVLFIRACTEPCTITAGKLYVMSMANFCSVVKTSVSYLTMLTSFQ